MHSHIELSPSLLCSFILFPVSFTPSSFQLICFLFMRFLMYGQACKPFLSILFFFSPFLTPGLHLLLTPVWGDLCISEGTFIICKKVMSAGVCLPVNQCVTIYLLWLLLSCPCPLTSDSFWSHSNTLLLTHEKVWSTNTASTNSKYSSLLGIFFIPFPLLYSKNKCWFTVTLHKHKHVHKL